MENKQAIANIKQGKNIPYKHETITTLVNMANKLEKIEQIVEEWNNDTEKDIESFDTMKRIEEVLNG